MTEREHLTLLQLAAGAPLAVIGVLVLTWPVLVLHVLRASRR